MFVAVSLLSCLSGQQLLAGPCSAFGVSNVENFFPESVRLPKWCINVQENIKILNLILIEKFIGNWFLYGTFDEGMPLHDFDCIQFVHKLSSYGNLRTTEYATDLASKTYVSYYNWASPSIILNQINYFIVDPTRASVAWFSPRSVKDSIFTKQVNSKKMLFAVIHFF